MNAELSVVSVRILPCSWEWPKMLPRGFDQSTHAGRRIVKALIFSRRF